MHHARSSSTPAISPAAPTKPGANDGGASEGGTTTAEGGTSTGAFELTVPAAIIPTPGGSVDVIVTIVRHDGFNLPINLTLADNTLGLSAAPVVVDATAPTARLSVAATTAGMLGDLRVDVRGAAGANTASQPLAIHVGGASGTLDTSFGAGGISLFQAQQGAETHGYRVTIQPDGLPLVGGGCVVNHQDYFVARTLLNGTLDPAFGNGGKLALDFNNTDDFGASASLLPDGRIILAGAEANPPISATASAALVRLSASGKYDATFGTGGATSLAVTGGFDAAQYAWDVGGKLLVSGSQFFVARYSEDGILDATFGAGGKSKATVGTIEDTAFFSTVTKDGGLLQSGYTTKTKTDVATDKDWAIVRFKPDGNVDASFGTNGLLTLGFGGNDDEGGQTAEDSQGRILVVGKSDRRGIITRLTATGQVDTTFGQNGYVFINDPTNAVYAVGLTLQGDRMIVVGGFSDNTGTNAEVTISRYDANGVLDPTFGTKGTTVLPLGPLNDFSYDVRQAPNGYLYVVGDSLFDGVSRAFLARLWP